MRSAMPQLRRPGPRCPGPRREPAIDCQAQRGRVAPGLVPGVGWITTTWLSCRADGTAWSLANDAGDVAPAALAVAGRTGEVGSRPRDPGYKTRGYKMPPDGGRGDA